MRLRFSSSFVMFSCIVGCCLVGYNCCQLVVQFFRYQYYLVVDYYYLCFSLFGYYISYLVYQLILECEFFQYYCFNLICVIGD